MNKQNNSNKAKRCTAFLIAILMLVESVIPSFSYALSGGPSQPEVEGFTPVGTTDMVDLFTGDFNYNIPLMDVDGYPINLGYQSGVNMDQEASWVGLGWNLNPGSINRSMRGLPDDFNGDDIKRKVHIKPSTTISLSGSAQVKLFGFQFSKKTDLKYNKAGVSLGINLELFYNNYKGMGVNLSPDWDVELSKDKAPGPPQPTTQADTSSRSNPKDAENQEQQKKKAKAINVLNKTMRAMLKSQIAAIPGVSLLNDKKRLTEVFAKNGRASLSELKQGYGIIGDAVSSVSAYYPNGAGYLPKLSNNMQNYNFSFDMSFGAAAFSVFTSPKLKVALTWQGTDGENFTKKAYGAYYYKNNNTPSSDVLLDFNRDHEGEYTKNKPILPMPVNMYDIYSISGQGVGGMFRAMRNGITVFHDDQGSSSSSSGGGSLDLGGGTDAHTKLNVKYSYNEVITKKWNNAFTDRLTDNTTNYAEFEPNYFKLAGEKNAVNTNLLYYQRRNIPYKPKIEKEYLFSVKARESIDADNEPDADLYPNYGGNIYDNKRTIRNQFVSVLTFAENEAFQNPIITPGAFMPSPALNENDQALREKYSIQQNYTWLTNTIIPVSKLTTTTNTPDNNVIKESNIRKNHHIGEITLNQTNGSRYVYGVAAYNNEQTEYTFNIGPVQGQNIDGSNFPFSTTGPLLEPTTNIVDISILKELAPGQSFPIVDIYKYFSFGYGKLPGEDSKSDQFFNSTKTPGFAHAYLLSSILQPDYVDIAPKGTGPEDLGNYTKFNYIRTATNYKWRTPAQQGKATFIEGLRSQSHDNKVSFVEGSKELWYLQAIEGKNHVALFVIEPRQDARAIMHDNASPVANDINNYSFRLKRIVLMTRQEYETNSTSPLTTATPIKTVWFDYDYSLCQSINNTWSTAGTTGKLTLKSLYFTFGKSTKKVNTYSFTYPTTMHGNPDYNQSNVDRWGNYKRTPKASEINEVGEITVSGEPNNTDFPFVKQNKAEADENAAAWLLQSIKLPSGGIININYESDDYAYVQNRRAGQMMKIEAMNDIPVFPGGNKNELYNASGSNKNHLFFKIPDEVYNNPAYNATQRREAKLQYMYQCIDQVQDMAFKILIGVSENGDKEWVSGYASVQGSGIPADLNTNYFYVIVKCLDIEARFSTRDLHPFTKAGLNFAKSNLPFVVNPNSLGEMAEGKANAKDYAMKLLGLSSMMETLWGVNDNLIGRNFCRYLDLDKSYCRLNEPFKKRLGGGVRVKKITINDSWAKITRPPNAVVLQGDKDGEDFGQEFDYTEEEEVTDEMDVTKKKVRRISTGVAAYEPAAGGDENPFKQPIGFSRKEFLSPDEDQIIDGPIGESFFPSPSVGYAKVTVSNIGRSIGSLSVKSNGVGTTVSCFYTAKDFPTIISHTAITDESVKMPLIDVLVYKSGSDEKWVSQGFSVECNDMHGKPKSVEVYKQLIGAETLPKLLTGTYYKYKTDPNNSNKLDNSNIPAVDDKGNITLQTMGVESEMYADNREKTSNTYGGTVELIFEVITIIVVPIPTPFPFIPIYPTYETNDDNFFSTTLNKVSTTYGIIDEVKVIQDGSEITTKNIAYDMLTGDALITKTTNEFKKDVYNTTYPAHWIYDNMGHGYKNIGLTFSGVTFGTGSTIVLPGSLTEADYLCHGDEVLLNNTTVAIINKVGSDFYLYNTSDGGRIIGMSGSFSMKIIRSGRRNMQNAPIFTATSLQKPFTSTTSGSTTTTNLDLTPAKQIVDAKATTYQLDQSKYKGFYKNYITYADPSIPLSTPYPYNKREHIEVLNYLLSENHFVVGNFVYNQKLHPSQTTSTSYYKYDIPSTIFTGDNVYTKSFIYKNILRYNSNSTSNPHGHSLFFSLEINSSLNIAVLTISFKFENVPHYANNVNYDIQLALPLTINNISTENFLQQYELEKLNINTIYPALYDDPLNCQNRNILDGNIQFKKVASPFNQFNYQIPAVTNFNAAGLATYNNRTISLFGAYGDNTNCLNMDEWNLTLENASYNNNATTALNIPSPIVKPYGSFLYKDERIMTTTRFSNANGIYKTFGNFFDLTNKTLVGGSKWKVAEMSTLFDPYTGAEIESKDALGRYRSIVHFKDQFVYNFSGVLPNNKHYGISHKPQLYIENARQAEATVFNFETKNELNPFNYEDLVKVPFEKHYFEVIPGINNNNIYLTNQGVNVAPVGHTGSGALAINADARTTANFYIAQNYPSSLDNAIMPFYPKVGKKYVISGWVKNDKEFYQSANLSAARCKVEVLTKNKINDFSTTICTLSGPVIEGWQRFSGEFTIENGTVAGVPTDAFILRVTLENTASVGVLYFDDVRLHPADANIKNYIYDEQHRVKAMLDENNYATFYQYNQKGELVSVRRETEKGIVTIQENRKNNSNSNE